MTRIRLCTVLLIALGTFALLSGCDAGGGDAFAAGAFPPTLSDTEDHARSWTRDDCMVCHEVGVSDAPKLEHKSVPAVTKEAKCRTCHVFVPGSEPRK